MSSEESPARQCCSAWSSKAKLALASSVAILTVGVILSITLSLTLSSDKRSEKEEDAAARRYKLAFHTRKVSDSSATALLTKEERPTPPSRRTSTASNGETTKTEKYFITTNTERRSVNLGPTKINGVIYPTRVPTETGSLFEGGSTTFFTREEITKPIKTTGTYLSIPSTLHSSTVKRTLVEKKKGGTNSRIHSRTEGDFTTVPRTRVGHSKTQATARIPSLAPRPQNSIAAKSSITETAPEKTRAIVFTIVHSLRGELSQTYATSRTPSLASSSQSSIAAKSSITETASENATAIAFTILRPSRIEVSQTYATTRTPSLASSSQNSIDAKSSLTETTSHNTIAMTATTVGGVSQTHATTRTPSLASSSQNSIEAKSSLAEMASHNTIAMTATTVGGVSQTYATTKTSSLASSTQDAAPRNTRAITTAVGVAQTYGATRVPSLAPLSPVKPSLSKRNGGITPGLVSTATERFATATMPAENATQTPTTSSGPHNRTTVTPSTTPSKGEEDPMENKLDVLTKAGMVRGARIGKAIVFKGIPYALPPVGNLRWKTPKPCTKGICWKGTFSASSFGNSCPQFLYRRPHGSEDCLVLNVWTPGLDNKKRPVLFFIHGGSLTFGSGHDAGVHPTPDLVKELDIVGVSINYRLNVFGFLALAALANDWLTKTSGNYGFMDQIMALTWVRENIVKFGGNPGRVILLGHSSGGTSSVGLLTSPLARGLFHGAIIMSGSAVFDKSSASVAKDNEVFLSRMGCDSASFSQVRECLYGSRTERLVRRAPWYVYPFWSMWDLTDLPKSGHLNGALATIDGHVIPFPPLAAMATGKGINDVPVLIGSTAQEIDFYPGKDFSSSSFEKMENYTRNQLSGFLETSEMDKMFNLYSKYRSHPQLFYSTVASDIRVTCPSHVMAMNASLGFKNPVYRYVVTRGPSKPVKVPLRGARATPYAFHEWDLQAFFGFPQGVGYTPSVNDKQFMHELRRELGHFILKGRVKSSLWKGFPASTGVFSVNGLKIQSDYHKKECEFWLKHGLFRYGWIN